MLQIQTPAPIKHPDRFFIDGDWSQPSSDAEIEVINCSTEELFVRVAEVKEADVNRAVAAARQAFDRGRWPRMSHAERGSYLRGIAREIDRRAHDLAHGGRPAHLTRGFYVEPTVFGNVDNHSTIALEEIFGPVLSVIPADSEADAVDIANDSIYGLNASVFTNDVDRAYCVARQLRSGTVGHNSFRTDFSVAFGGFKHSGIGREGGTEGKRITS